MQLLQSNYNSSSCVVGIRDILAPARAPHGERRRLRDRPAYPSTVQQTHNNAAVLGICSISPSGAELASKNILTFSLTATFKQALPVRPESIPSHSCERMRSCHRQSCHWSQLLLQA